MADWLGMEGTARLDSAISEKNGIFPSRCWDWAQRVVYADGNECSLN